MGAAAQDDVERGHLCGIEPVIEAKRSSTRMTIEALIFEVVTLPHFVIVQRRQISRVLTQMAGSRAPPYRLTRRWAEKGSCRRRQRAGHDHAAFGVVADIESRANGFGPVAHDFLAHALRLVEILPQPSAVIFDR